MLQAFHGRVLSVDTTVAQHCARLRVPDLCSERDTLIADDFEALLSWRLVNRAV